MNYFSWPWWAEKENLADQFLGRRRRRLSDHRPSAFRCPNHVPRVHGQAASDSSVCPVHRSHLASARHLSLKTGGCGSTCNRGMPPEPLSFSYLLFARSQKNKKQKQDAVVAHTCFPCCSRNWMCSRNEHRMVKSSLTTNGAEANMPYMWSCCPCSSKPCSGRIKGCWVALLLK